MVQPNFFVELELNLYRLNQLIWLQLTKISP